MQGRVGAGSRVRAAEGCFPMAGRSYFDVSIDASELTGALDAFAKRGGRLDDTMAVAAEMLVAAVNDKFQAGGPGWAPLA
jgi:hypothetical protein